MDFTRRNKQTGETKIMRIRAWYAIVLMFTAFFCFHSQAIANDDDAVLKVGDNTLTERDLNEVVDEIIPTAVFHGGVTEEKRVSFISQAMDTLVERELIYQEAISRKMKIDKARIKQAKEDISNRLGGWGAFKRSLERKGITEKDYDKKLQRHFLVQDLIQEEIEQKSIPDSEEVEEHYAKNKSRFMRPEARRVRHILIKVEPERLDEKPRLRERADFVLKKLREGEDFAKIAWDYSDDPYAVKGGELGLIHRGRLDPAIDDVIYTLKVGEISNAIETIYGFHIVKIDEIKEPTQLKFEDVSASITSRIKEQRLAERKKDFMDALRNKYKVEILKKQ